MDAITSTKIRWNGSNLHEIEEFLRGTSHYVTIAGRMNAVRLNLCLVKSVAPVYELAEPRYVPIYAWLIRDAKNVVTIKEGVGYGHL